MRGLGRTVGLRRETNIATPNAPTRPDSMNGNPSMHDGGAMTDEERAEALAWQGRAVGPNERRKTCAYCGHPYYWPCEADEHERCGNFQHFQHMRAAVELRVKK